MSISKCFAELVVSRRAQLGMSQIELSQVAGISRRSIQYIEKGERDVSIVNFLKVSRALRLNLSSTISVLNKQLD